MLELPTYEQLYRDVIFLDRERSFLSIRTSQTQVLFSIDIRVQAGIDFSRGIRLEPDGSDKKSIRVFLPEAVILLVDADETSIHQFFVKEVRGSIALLDYYDEIERAKEEIRADAIEREILLNAGLNAREIVKSFLEAAGFEEVSFGSI